MMTLYEINVIEVDYYTGIPCKGKVIARTINPNKVNTLIENFRNENQVNQWWLCYAKDENENIKMEVKEYEVIE